MELKIDKTDRLQCQICGKVCAKHCSVVTHLKRTHQIEDMKKYYDEYFKQEGEGFCKYCGKPVPFVTLKDGYKQFCDRTCFWHYTTHSDEVKEKRKQTCLEKYGTTQYLSSKDCKEKSINTLQKNYNVTNVFCLPEVKAKIRATKLERYGSETYNNMDKNRATKLERYDNEWYYNREKALNTMAEKYNVAANITSPFGIPEISKKALGHVSSMTTPEKKLNEFLTNRKFKFRYGYECNGKNFDFAIFKADKLAILIEIDGLYYHGLTEDCNGKHVRGETDCERFSKVPEGVKFIVCDETRIEECFTEILKAFDVDYDTWIQSIIDNLPQDFPYPTYDMKRMQTDYEHLQQWDYNKNSNVGSSIVRNYHKSIWNAHVGKCKSPVECWSDKNLLAKTVKNRVIYSSTLSSQAIAAGFNVCKTAPKVSVFKPILAKHIIETYLKEYNEIFDPFSGFSGRMLGACALNKKYIGQDINEMHVSESKQIINDFNLNATVECKDIFTSTGEYECLFTCSPYSLKEVWNDNETDKTCDEWIDECMKRFKCKRYVFVVDNTEKYKDKIVETISNNSHFGNNNEYVVVI